jgi:hypothetical protein
LLAHRSGGKPHHFRRPGHAGRIHHRQENAIVPVPYDLEKLNELFRLYGLTRAARNHIFRATRKGVF